MRAVVAILVLALAATAVVAVDVQIKSHNLDKLRLKSASGMELSEQQQAEVAAFMAEFQAANARDTAFIQEQLKVHKINVAGKEEFGVKPTDNFYHPYIKIANNEINFSKKNVFTQQEQGISLIESGAKAITGGKSFEYCASVEWAPVPALTVKGSIRMGVDIRVDNLDDPKKLTVTLKGAIGLTVSVLIFSAFGEGEVEAEIEIVDASKTAGAASVPNLWENPSDAVWHALKVLIFNLMGKEVPSKESAFITKMTTVMKDEYPTVLTAINGKAGKNTNTDLTTKFNDGHVNFLVETCKAMFKGDTDAANPFKELKALSPKVIELMKKLKDDKKTDQDIAKLPDVKRTKKAGKSEKSPPANTELCSWTFGSGYYDKCQTGYASDGYCNCAPEIAALNSRVADHYETVLFKLWAKLNMNYDDLESTPDCKKLLDDAKGPIKNADAEKMLSCMYTVFGIPINNGLRETSSWWKDGSIENVGHSLRAIFPELFVRGDDSVPKVYRIAHVQERLDLLTSKFASSAACTAENVKRETFGWDYGLHAAILGSPTDLATSSKKMVDALTEAGSFGKCTKITLTGRLGFAIGTTIRSVCDTSFYNLHAAIYSWSKEAKDGLINAAKWVRNPNRQLMHEIVSPKDIFALQLLAEYNPTSKRMDAQKVVVKIRIPFDLESVGFSVKTGLAETDIKAPFEALVKFFFTYFPCALYNTARPGAWKEKLKEFIKELFSEAGFKDIIVDNAKAGAKALFYYILSFIKGLSGGVQDALFVVGSNLAGVAAEQVKQGGFKKLFVRMAKSKVDQVKKMSWDEVAKSILTKAGKLFIAITGLDDIVKSAISTALGGAEFEKEAKFGFDIEIPLKGNDVNLELQCSKVTNADPISVTNALPGGVTVAFVQESTTSITSPSIPTPAGTVKISGSTTSSSDVTWKM